MKTGFAVLFTALLLGPGAAESPAQQAAAPRLVLLGAVVIDGSGESAPRRAAVIIDGDVIQDVVDDSLLQPFSGARVIDLAGKWIMPGLIDAHTHFLQDGGLFALPWRHDLRKYVSYESETTRISENIGSSLSRYVCAGVTSVMSLAGPRWDFKVRKLATEMATAPDVAVAGPWVESYGDTDVPFWTSDDPGYAQISNPADIRELLDELAALGVDIVKIGPERANILSDFISEAHIRGLRVAVHAMELSSAKAALRAGADLLAHLVTAEPIDQEFIDLVREKQVVSVTTLGYPRAQQQVLTGQPELLPIETRCGDPAVIQSWTMLEGLPAADRPRPSDGVDVPESTALGNLRALYEAGLPIAVGSDAGNLGVLQGGSYHRDLALMARAGMAPMDIITAATRNGARAMARESDVGTIRPGMRADLVVLEADPLADISNAQRVYAVVRRGRFLEGAELTDFPGKRH